MTLPGMPIRAGDPGVFICGPGDIAPWETERPPAPRRLASVPRAPRRAAAVWLVLSICPGCSPITGRYCHEHNAENWWLTNWGHGGVKRKNARPA